MTTTLTATHPSWCSGTCHEDDYHRSEPVLVPATGGDYISTGWGVVVFPCIELYAQVESGAGNVLLSLGVPTLGGNLLMPDDSVDIELSLTAVRAMADTLASDDFDWQAAPGSAGRVWSFVAANGNERFEARIAPYGGASSGAGASLVLVSHASRELMSVTLSGADRWNLVAALRQSASTVESE